jgi:hypothetical protein
MPILNSTQIAAAARNCANVLFVIPGATAILNLTQLITAVTACDTAMSLTPAAFASTYSSAGNVAAGLGTAIFASVSGITQAQAAVVLESWTQQAALV